MKETRSAPGLPEAKEYAVLRAWDETLRVADEAVYWLRRDPESGHTSLRTVDALGTEYDVLGTRRDIRSIAQGYGGGAYCVAGGRIVFVDGDDGALHIAAPGQPSRQLTESGPHTHGDLVYDAQHDRVICIRETLDASCRTEVLAIPLAHGGIPRVLASTSGFLAAPRPSPCGRYLAWIRWEFPDMPWDASTLEIWEAGTGGAAPRKVHTIGHPGVSIIEPRWSSDSTLFFLDDRSGWWLPHAWRPNEASRALVAGELEFGFAPYKLGLSTYAVCCAGDGLPAVMLAAAWRAGKLILLKTDLASGESVELPLPFEEIRDLQFARGMFWFVGTTADAPARIMRLDPCTWIATPHASLIASALRPPNAARPLAFPARDGMTVHAHLRLPADKPARGGYRLVVNIHGGPTGIATQAFDPVAQFWLESGFAHLEVNHRGSTGFGRRYREALNGQWGIAETRDCIDAVEHVCRIEHIDASQIFIRGNSAGGFTALRALLESGCFRAAGCYYGVSDLSRLTRETHKFESQYTFSLIGAYPAHGERYDDRSPLTSRKRIAAPVVFFQGALDTIVDPAQTRRLADAMRHDGVPSRYVEFADEGHGFNKAANFAHALEIERAFYNDMCVGATGHPHPLDVPPTSTRSAMEPRNLPADSSASPSLSASRPAANEWIAQVPPYRPGGGGDAENRDAIRLCSNENPFGKTRLAELVQRVAECNIALYPDNDYPGLKAALAQLHGVRQSQLLIGSGSSEVLTLLARTFLSRSRVALCSTYSFSLYSIVTSITGAAVRRVPSLEYGHDTAALLSEAGNAQVIFIDNPCNPTGRHLSKDAWAAFMREVPRSTLVVVDEAYAEYVTAPDFESAIRLVDQYPNLIVVRTLSKAYGLAGLRLGYGIAGEALIEQLERARPPFNVNALSCELAKAALADTSFLEACRSHNAAQRTRLETHPAIAPYRVSTSQGNFIFLKVPGAAGLANALRERHIHIRAFAEYPDHLRVTIGTVEENQRFLDAFAEANALHDAA